MKQLLSIWLRTHPSAQLPLAILRTRRSMFTAISNIPKLHCPHQPLFIVGAGRSGNTLLRKLLVENYEIFIPAETYVIPKSLRAFLKEGGDWSKKVKVVLSVFEQHPEFATLSTRNLSDVYDRCISLPMEKQTCGEIIYEILDHFARESKCPYQVVGDKTPLNTMSLGLISTAFPAARFLFITRNPVDVVSSYLSMGRYKNAKDASQRWSDSHRAWLRFAEEIEADRLFLARYENLVQNPNQLLSEVETWASLKKRVEPLSNDFFWGDISAIPHHANTFHDITASEIGKGMKRMNNEQIKVIGKKCNWAADLFGFEVI